MRGQMKPFDGSAADTGWNNLPLTNSWVQYSVGIFDAQYHRLNGFVELAGLVKNGSAANAVICVLPVGFRPRRTRIFTCATAAQASPAQVYVGADGTVQAQANGNVTWTSLDGIVFAASQ